MTRTARRDVGGFTLVEILVTLSIIGLLIALLIPAVQSAREASRRAACSNQLKQVIVALANFQTANGRYPPASPASLEQDGAATTIDYQIAPQVFLLPFLENTIIYNSINFSLKGGDYGYAPANQTATRTRLTVFLCPSDSFRGSNQAYNSYRANLGTSAYEWDQQVMADGGLGAFSMAYQIDPSDVQDGLSQTVFFAERRIGAGNKATFDQRRDYGCLGLDAGPFPKTEQFVEMCQLVPRVSEPFCSNDGWFWYQGSYSSTWYNHTVVPNTRLASCKLNPCLNPELSSNTAGIFGATSDHHGGVNVAFGDGSVRFVAETLSLPVWKGLGTRSGGEPIASY